MSSIAKIYGTSQVKDQFKAGSLPGKYFTETNSITGEITVKRKGTVSGSSGGTYGVDLIQVTTIGSIDKKTKKFISSGDGVASENTYFNSDQGTTVARQQAQTITTRSKAVEDNISYRQAVEETQALFGTNKSATEEAAGETSNPAAADGSGSGDVSFDDGDDATSPDGSSAMANAVSTSFSSKPKGGSRKSYPGANGSAPLVFPDGLSSSEQDVIKFNMLEYAPKGVTNNNSSFGGQDRAGMNRKIVGSIVLPIPAGIADQNNVDWGPNSMGVAQMATMGIADDLLSAKGGDDKSAIDNTIDDLSTNSDQVKDALRKSLAAAATGGNPNALLSRTTGQVLNPNMELLFNAPALRPFNFTFQLSPRNSREATNIVKVIRFFKQGMAPTRTESNLFLKSPNTFQLQYLRQNKRQHRFLNMFKECALQSFGVQYTPNNNYSVYKDGSMQQYSIQMTFTELEPVFNDEYPNDNDSSVGF